MNMQREGKSVTESRIIPKHRHEPVKPHPWQSRVSGMPYLPGGSKRQLEALRILLREIVRVDGLKTASVDLGDGTNRTVRDAVKQIAPTGMLERAERDRVSISAPAKQWLDTGDNYWVFSEFHRNVRFFGELLVPILRQPLTVRDLNGIAEKEYQLPWSTLDQTRRRINWFIDFGFLHYKTNLLIDITDVGRAYAPLLLPGGPSKTVIPVQTGPVEVNDPPSAIKTLLEDLTRQGLVSRSPILGYIPKGNGDLDAVRSIELLVNSASPSISRADWILFCEKTFGMSEGSFGAALTTLTKSGLIEQSGMNVFSPTEVGQQWLETASALDLARLFHTRFGFFLEIIPALNEYDRAPELARMAVDQFGLPRADVGGIRTRLQILKAAGLITERANWRYQSTPLGDEIAARTLLQEPMGAEGSTHETEAAPSQDAFSAASAALAEELNIAGLASDSPMRLEKAVADAFRYLGFESQHIGGAGKTDVLVSVIGPDRKPVRIIVDAKAAKSGGVAEGSVSFDTLLEHKRQHQADLVVLVGPGFDDGRIRARALQNEVALLTTAELAAVVRRQARHPISTESFIKLVHWQESSRQEFEAEWTQVERKIALLGHIVGVLAKEAQDADDVTLGALSSDQIYLIVRDQSETRPSPNDISNALTLLQHPLVQSIRTRPASSGRPLSYYLVDSPILVSKKIASLAVSLEGLSEHVD